jgi:GNAT superfamily N-acetyltransferase
MLIRKAQPSDAPAIARVHVDSWRTSYAGILSGEFLAALSYEARQEMWSGILARGESILYVAETPTGQVVGFAGGGRERTGDRMYQGELYVLYLLQSFQRQGTGRALFNAVAAELRQAGLTSLLVWVLSANPARQFYEALGGEFLWEKDIEIGGQRLVEAAYGWKDTRAMLAQAVT